MISILSGDPGSGKSLRALSWMEDADRAGRKIFTNIDLLPTCPFYSRVYRIDTPGFPICAETPQEPHGYQYFWEYIPNGAFICIDEGDIHFDSADWKIFGKNCRIYHKQHRKFDHDIVYIVQNVPNMYNRIRRLCGRFVHAEHTLKTLRWMGLVRTVFGLAAARRLSRFLYAEFTDETLKRMRGMGHMSFAEGSKYFSWYKTKQLLGDTEKILKRTRKQVFAAAESEDDLHEAVEKAGV